MINIKADESYFRTGVKESTNAARQEKSPYPDFESPMAGFIPYLLATQQTATLQPIIREQVKPDSIVYTDCYRLCAKFETVGATPFTLSTTLVMK
ncbi:hypothetical protein C7N83_09910 [Neisseria iguanae]|uniref:Uncharacterized protein n=1 Tax=Neisseria iguanae TaxID=90242 RepID=A0A2P7TYM1_9NEIS|nr:hypothetical protein C7N83_09910 [Neisseria iguanae]